MKKVFFWFLKATCACMLAFVLMSVFCYFYYNLPIHFNNESGATDFVWEPNHFSSRGTEGYAVTYTDENGFVNTYPEKKDTIDILIMGSSHGEAFNVNANQNFTYLLNKKLHDKNLYAYSICASGHNLVNCLNNLDEAIAKYKPSKYIVLEAHSIAIRTENLKKLDAGEIERQKSYDSGLIYYLQKFDYLRLVYFQLSNAIDNQLTDTAKPKQQSMTEYALYLEKAISKAHKAAEEAGCKLVILYSPHLKVDYYGNVLPQEYTEEKTLFKELCGKYTIDFLDMFDAFSKNYNDTFHLPHGFSNTAIGEGHTNQYGHACVAEELYQYLITQE